MKKLILFSILFLTFGITYSQTVSSVRTEYTQVEKGVIGRESFTFSLYNSYIHITDNDYNRKTQYGPLYLDDYGYKEGYYYDFYKPDVRSNPLSFTGGKDLKAYRFIYKSKGGVLYRVDEMLIRNKQVSVKTFYTSEGYKDATKSTSENFEVRADFDIRDMIINSNSLTELMGRINFSFEQTGDKKMSNDEQFVTVRYDNESNVTPLVVYNRTGQVKQIIFLVPQKDAENVIKELIIKYDTRMVDGQEVIVKDNLIYDYDENDGVGIIIIKQY